MANNRMFLNCKGCGDYIGLGKTYLDGYCNAPNSSELAEFYTKHHHCYEHDIDLEDIDGYFEVNITETPFYLSYEHARDKSDIENHYNNNENLKEFFKRINNESIISKNQ